jgi:hypothetical protein
MDFIAGLILGAFVVGGMAQLYSMQDSNNGWIQCKLQPKICEARFTQYKAEIKLEKLREKNQKEFGF